MEKQKRKFVIFTMVILGIIALTLGMIRFSSNEIKNSKNEGIFSNFISKISEKSNNVTVNIENKPIIDVMLSAKGTSLDLSNFEEDVKAKLQSFGVDTKNFNFQTSVTQTVVTSSTDVNFEEAVNGWKKIGEKAWKANSSGQIYLDLTAGGINFSKNFTPEQNYANCKPGWYGEAIVDNKMDSLRNMKIDFSLDQGGQLLGGVTFNTKIEDDGSLSGYFFTISTHGGDLRLYKISHYAIDDYFDSGANAAIWCGPDANRANAAKWPYVDWHDIVNDPWVVGNTTTVYNAGINNNITSTISTIAGWVKPTGQNIKYSVITDTKTGHIIIKENGVDVVNLYDDTYTSGTYGLWGNNCEKKQSMYISDFKVTGEKDSYLAYKEILTQPTWRENAEHIVVNVDDQIDETLTGTDTIGEVLTRTLNDDIHFIQWGNDTNKNESNDFISRNDNKGTFVDNSDYNNCVEKTAEYIKSLIEQDKDSQYVIVGEDNNLSVEPNELKTGAVSEKFPNGRWRVNHNYTYFANDLGQSVNTEVYTPDLICNFDKPGEYNIYFDDELVKQVYAHRKPVAEFSLTISGGSITTTSNSFDLDSDEDIGYGKGISDEKWYYKNVNDENWTEGKLTSLDTTQQYIIKLEVTDFQGATSYATKYIGQGKPVASFNYTESTITKYERLVINDTSYDPVGNTISAWEWTLKKNGTVIGKYNSNMPSVLEFNTDTLGVGEYTYSLVVTNNSGNKSDEYTKKFNVIGDIYPPEVVITPTSCDWRLNQEVDVNFSDNDSGFSKWRYSIDENSNTSSTTIWGEFSTTATNKININKKGQNYLHIQAYDNAGNLLERTVGIYKIGANLKLTATYNDDIANLVWTNSDNVSQYFYRVMKKEGDGEYRGLSAEGSGKVKVLNVYPNVADNTISFVSSADGNTYNLSKAASLKMWMEQANSEDARGYGRGIINVDTVSIDNFNTNPSAYLYKNASGEYNYDVVMFGTWDNNNSQDLSASSASVTQAYINSGGSVIFGHDTLVLDRTYFASLASNLNITLNSGNGYNGVSDDEDGYGVTAQNLLSNVRIVKTGIFTTYPWSIGDAGTNLVVPSCHTSAHFALGDIWIRFIHPNYTESDMQDGNNFFLTTYNNCAMIQTGHSNCAATSDEQKIISNLIFYLSDIETKKTAIDPDFKDKAAPSIPEVTSNVVTGLLGNVSVTSTDNGTEYSYYVEGTESVSQLILSSNIVSNTRTTGVAGYSYVIDNVEDTADVDTTIDNTTGTIDYEIGDGPKTYLHIRTIDGAGNVSDIKHILLHSNYPPTLELVQDKTEWTNENVVITATGIDTDGTVVEIKKPDGVIASGATTTFEVDRNGTYEFIAKDNGSATVTETIEITNIDKVKPTGVANVTLPTGDKKTATVRLDATDDLSGVARIINPDGSETVGANSEVEIGESGEYTFTILDKAGNSENVVVKINISSEGVDVKYVDVNDTSIVLKEYTIEGNQGEEYTTEQEEFENYKFVRVEGNATGKLAVDKQTVIYYYVKQSNVVVKYIDENTGVEIIGESPVTTKYREGDIYRAEKKEIEGYTYTKDSGNTTGTVAREDIEVVYYYKKTSAGIEIRYIDQVTGEEIADTEYEEGLEKDSYTTTPKDIGNYELVVTPENASGQMSVEKITVTYEYRKNSNVTVKYVDENTGAEITGESPVITKYKEGDTYRTEKKTISGYTYTKDSGNTTGEVGREDIEVIYYYKKTSAGIEIRYIDQVTGDIIADTIIKIGVENEAYTSEAKEIEGYRLVITPTNANGQMTVEKIVVTYEYRKLSNVVTRYIDENHGTSLSDSVQATYMEQESYSTEKKTIDGYTYTTDTNNTSGLVGRVDIEVTYYYKKNTSVIVKYVDMLDSNKEISKAITISGLENQDYITEQKEIEGYVFEEVEGITNGKMGSDTTEVIYKYKKESNLITEHIDENTGEKIIEDVIKTYKEGENYEALAQNIEGYVVTREPEEKTGVMGRENITKTYYYKKISGGLTVKYVDSVLGELLDQKEYSGNEGDVIKLEEKDIAGYVIVERPNYTEVTLSEEPREIIYYYKKALKIDIIGIDTDTKEELYKTDISGIEGEEYRAEARDVEGYELVVIPENKNGIFKRNITTIVYEYKMLSGKLTVRYVDKETNEELDRYEISGKVGDNYKTDKKEFNNYNFVEVVGEEVGILTKEDKEIVYYYERKTGTVVIRYIDEAGNELLREEMTGKVEEKYVVEQKEIEGYDIVEVPKNIEGEYKEGIEEVIFIVSKSDVKPIDKDKIIVRFIDEKGNIIKEDYVVEGQQGDNFHYELPEIEGYKIVGEKEIIAVFEKGELVFDVEYEKIDNMQSPPNTGDIAVGIFTVLALMSIGGIVYVVVKNRKNK